MRKIFVAATNIKFVALAFVVSCAMMVTGCTDAQRAKIGTIGGNQEITCYSGGITIYSGISSGKVSSEAQSDGYFFKDADTGELLEVSADCIIKG